MKKLMIAAAAAALVGGAFAALPEDGDTINLETRVGVMHNVSITVKTLMPTVYDTTKTKGCAICPTTDGGKCYLFEQGTLKINGIFATCDCDSLFDYCYFWLGSGKKATKLLDALDATQVELYDDLPQAANIGLDFYVARYSKTLKKAAVQFTFTDAVNGRVELSGNGFGSYTEAKYKYDKDADEYILKSLAKVSASGSVIGEITVEALAAYLYDQGKLSREDAAEEFKYDIVDDGCTIAIDDCTNLDTATAVPVSGTFSIKGTTTKALNKVIPAACWN